MCAARVAAICGSTNLGVPRLTRRANVVSRRRGNKGNTCGFAGAGVCNRLSFAALNVAACRSMSPPGAFFVRAFAALIPRGHRLRSCRETYHRQQAGSSRLEARHNRSSQLGRVLPRESQDYVGRALPHGRAREIVEPLAEAASQLWLPAIRHRRALLLQIDRCTTTLHKASINRKRRTAAQYVYSTKPSSSPQHQLQHC